MTGGIPNRLLPWACLELVEGRQRRAFSWCSLPGEQRRPAEQVCSPARPVQFRDLAPAISRGCARKSSIVMDKYARLYQFSQEAAHGRRTYLYGMWWGEAGPNVEHHGRRYCDVPCMQLLWPFQGVELRSAPSAETKGLVHSLSLIVSLAEWSDGTSSITPGPFFFH